MTTFAEQPPTLLSADGVLACAYLAGDETGFELLYRRYHPDVLRFVRASVKDHALAEDIAQEAMARALRYLRSYDPSQPLWPWLRKITRSVVAAEMGRRSSEVPVDQIDRDVFVLPDSADSVVLRAAVEESMRLLPKRQSRALLLRYLEDRDPNDIAVLFGLSRNALEQLLLRGRTNFVREYHARNAGLVPVPGLAALSARLRRLVSGAAARVQAATGTTMSVAGEVAIGAALTVGTVGVAAIGDRLTAPDERGVVPGGPTTRYVEPGGRDLAAGEPLLGGPRRGGLGQVPYARAITGAGAAGPTTWSAGGGSATRPDQTGRADDAGDAVAAPAPSGQQAPPPPAVRPSPEPGVEKAPEPAPAVPKTSAWVGDEGAGVAFDEDDVPNTSGQATAKSDPTQGGEVSKEEVKTEVAGQTVVVSGGVSNSSDESYTCNELKICLTGPRIAGASEDGFLPR